MKVRQLKNYSYINRFIFNVYVCIFIQSYSHDISMFNYILFLMFTFDISI